MIKKFFKKHLLFYFVFIALDKLLNKIKLIEKLKLSNIIGALN